MNILIAGGTGFIGQALTKHFLQNNDTVTILGRDSAKIQSLYGQSVTALTWDNLSINDIKSQDLIINLAGANIGEKKWTEKRKQVIFNSRIDSTKQIAELCATVGDASPTLFNTSAVGIYGLQTSQPTGLPKALDEDTTINFNEFPDFLSYVGRYWELVTEPAKKAGVRVVNLRFALVLDPSGGVLQKMLLPFKLGLGAKIGSGQQPFPWVALSDLIDAIDFLIQHTELNGPVNIIAPNTVTQKEFAKTLAKSLNRPCLFTIPAFILKAALGQMAEELLLNGTHAKPTKLLNAGFKFKHNKLEQTLLNR